MNPKDIKQKLLEEFLEAFKSGLSTIAQRDGEVFLTPDFKERFSSALDTYRDAVVGEALKEGERMRSRYSARKSLTEPEKRVHYGIIDDYQKRIKALLPQEEKND